MRVAQQIYQYPLEQHVLKVLPESGRRELERFKEDLRATFGYLIPTEVLESSLADLSQQLASTLITSNHGSSGLPDRAASRFVGVRHNVIEQMKNLQEVGLVARYDVQRTLASAMWEALVSYVRSTFTRKWDPRSENEKALRMWIESDFATFIQEVLTSTKHEAGQELDDLTNITEAEVEKWQEMAINQLGVLRTDELFNVVVEWESSKYGALEDLRTFIKTRESRSYLTTTFSNVISHRLLHPGASTTEILQVYISIIRVFTELDPKGVLLDRVARPIRRYLRERDDTATIVVGGLLADPEDESSADDALTELAVEMNKQNSLKADDAGDGDFDFDDMEWMPDPVDAGPDYKKSKNSDVIGSLISLFESKDVFVKEFQNVLGERLLKKEQEFDREIRVLELLKLRFGEAALQACEVMLRDILDSRRVNAFIHKDQELQNHPALHTRILSHLFWPSLHTETFHIPPEIASLQTTYESAFSSLKQSRKLTWLHALGQVTVTLDLEDRTVHEVVQTWQASVIHAFQPPPHAPPFTPITKSLPQLVSTLQMTESLVLNGLTFWIGKLVLKALPTYPTNYTVLETLSAEPAAQAGTTSAAIAAAAETATAAAAPAVLSEHEVANEKMTVFAQYVVGMLTNGGPMPLQQVVMMLKLTVPGGFPFGNEELKEFLDGEVRGGRLGFEGGRYLMLKG